MPTFIIIFSLFLLLFLPSSSTPSSMPRLFLFLLFLPLNCTLTSHQICENKNSVKTLLDNLTNEAPKTHFATLISKNFTGFIQCQKLDLNRPNSSFCIKYGKTTILKLCQNPKFLAVWFGECYLEFSQYKNNQTIVTKASSHTCFSKVLVNNRGNSPALETLLLCPQPQATSIRTHLGFSCSKIIHGENGGKIECASILSLKDCDYCLEQGMGMLQEQCGGRVLGGVVVVAEQCLVWFSSNCEFVHSRKTRSGLKSRNTIRNVESGDGNYSVGRLKRGFMTLWGLGIAFVAVIGICGCLVRRSIVNNAKVVTNNGIEVDEI